MRTDLYSVFLETEFLGFQMVGEGLNKYWWAARPTDKLTRQSSAPFLLTVAQRLISAALKPLVEPMTVLRRRSHFS
jgi:hypothetical protein